MKKLIVLLLALALLLTVFPAFAEDDGDDYSVLTVNEHDVTKAELKAAAELSMFESALQCAGYGYGYDIVDPANIANAMDVLVFDLEFKYTALDLAEERGLYPLGGESMAAAERRAEEEWEYYRKIAMSETAMPFLPAGDYEYIENDTEGNMIRYFASFGLTKEALLEEAIAYQADQELMNLVTADMIGKSEDDRIDYYTDWFLERMDEMDIVEDDEGIAEVIAEMGADPSENQGDDDFESFERSILIKDRYYTLGESTVRDFEEEGWTWTQEADGRFAFEVTEPGNYFYVRTDNNQPDGKVIMVDMFYAYEIPYEYLGFGFDLAFDPSAETDIMTHLESVYDTNYTDEGVLQARTAVRGGTLLIELGELALRLTLE